MLIEFTIENFTSIREKITFSMVATKDNSLIDNLIKSEELSDPLLKSAVLYGANASGKTNVLYALVRLRSMIINSHKYQKGDKIEFTPFKLNKDCLSKPTRYTITFTKNQKKYLYVLSFDSEKVIEESLYSLPYNKIIFERTNTNDYKFTEDTKIQESISERTLPNMLYLSKATQENNKLVSDAFDWFRNDIIPIKSLDLTTSDIEKTLQSMQGDESFKKLVLKALLVADLGIEDIKSITKKITADDLQDVPKEIIPLLLGDKKEREMPSVQTLHKGVLFDLEEESDGTRKMFYLIGHWIDALKNGKLLVIDELDTKLHHVLIVFLIRLFHDSTQNKDNAQLIFSTHNTNLLDQDIFRRDQIWFTEKNSETGSTELYSLVEFSPRKDKDLERGYLAGKYGALPFIKSGRIFDNE